MLSHEDQLKANIKQTLSFLKELIIFMNEDEKTDISPESIQTWVTLVDFVDSRDLMIRFCDMHDKWDKIYNHDTDFFIEELPKMFEGHDSEFITAPILEHRKLKKEFPKATADDQEEWCVSDIHMQTLWKHLKAYVAVSCRFVHHEMKPVKQADGSFKYKNLEEFGDIPVQKYIADFQIKL